ncbi:hypothetical protein KIPB_011530, partial [Kipferlia bialata]|eukprot:g11530.t1
MGNSPSTGRPPRRSMFDRVVGGLLNRDHVRDVVLSSTVTGPAERAQGPAETCDTSHNAIHTQVLETVSLPNPITLDKDSLALRPMPSDTQGRSTLSFSYSSTCPVTVRVYYVARLTRDVDVPVACDKSHSRQMPAGDHTIDVTHAPYAFASLTPLQRRTTLTTAPIVIHIDVEGYNPA